MSLRAEHLGQIRTDLALPATRERTLEDARVSAIRGFGHGAQRVDLGGVLAHTQPSGDQRRGAEFATRQRLLKPQEERRPHLIRNRDAAGGRDE